MPQSLAGVYLHIVFSTKNRAALIAEDVQPHLHRYLGGIANNLNCPIIRVGGTTDHVHILVRFGRTITIADLVMKLKSSSSAWMKSHCQSFTWQSGYGVFSFGEERLSELISYVENQAEHHRTVTFQEEFLGLLKEYDLAHDERYLWD